jgi:hypothetical protein
MDPAAAGGAPPAPGMPSAGGAPPPPAGVDPMLAGIIQQTVQMTMQNAQGLGGAGGPKKGGKGDEAAMQMYKMNVMLMAIIGGLNKMGADIQIPNEMMLGPPPGSDPTMAMQAAGAVPQPGTDPNAAQGQGAQDPNAPQGQQPMNFMPALAPKQAAEDEEAVEPLGRAIDKIAEMPITAEVREMFGMPEPPAKLAADVGTRAAGVMQLIQASRRAK